MTTYKLDELTALEHSRGHERLKTKVLELINTAAAPLLYQQNEYDDTGLTKAIVKYEVNAYEVYELLLSMAHQLESSYVASSTQQTKA